LGSSSYVSTSEAKCKHCGAQFRYHSVYNHQREVCNTCRTPRQRYHIRKKKNGNVNLCQCGRVTKNKNSLCLTCKNDIYQRIIGRKCPVCQNNTIKSIYCSRKCNNTAAHIIDVMTTRTDRVIVN